MKKDNTLRKEIAWMTYYSKEGHIASAYSIIDMVEFLYDNVLKFDPQCPDWDGRDYFVLSKGHGCAALYAVLKKHGFITQKDLEEKNTEYGKLATHPDRLKIPGVEASTGSLGTGIGMAVGIALGLKILNKPNKVICLIGDGESMEGTVWEAALVGAKYKLGNLCILADHNGSVDVFLPEFNPEEKWKAFGWNVYSIDGHNIDQLRKALDSISFEYDTLPNVIVAHTKKGKGVPFMERDFGYWHSRVPTEEQLQQIYDELDKGGESS